MNRNQMVYFSLILSSLVLFFVVRLTLVQRKFDWVNGLMLVCALAGVILGIDTIITNRTHESAYVLGLGVVVAWIISSIRARKA
ncbi:MAG: hypothetical protein WKF84_26520 [Pyrinomonadaceae bacterium]